MPELPDVETFRGYVNSKALRKKVASVEVRDKRILRDISAQGLGRKLHKKAFTETARHGKYMFAHAGDDGWLVFHFGMTGYPEYLKKGDEEPKHAKVVVEFVNGDRLAFVCRRMLGQVTYTEDPESFIESRDLGPDALEQNLDSDSFCERFDGRATAIKSLLMNQEIVAGIGNVYADEILFQCDIHPEKKVSTFEDADWTRLYRTMRRVLKVVCDKKAEPDDFPRGYLLPHRQAGADCPRCDGTIKKKPVSGRPTYFCSKHQK